MTDNIILRKAVLGDSEFAYRVKKTAFKAYIDGAGGWDEAKQRQLHEKRFREQEFRIINCSGTDVGVIAVVAGPDCLRVNQIFILPAYQGKGIGRHCMLKIIDEAQSLGLPVRLRVLKNNPRARAFFAQHGFKRIGENTDHDIMEKAEA